MTHTGREWRDGQPEGTGLDESAQRDAALGGHGDQVLRDRCRPLIAAP